VTVADHGSEVSEPRWVLSHGVVQKLGLALLSHDGRILNHAELRPPVGVTWELRDWGHVSQGQVVASWLARDSYVGVVDSTADYYDKTATTIISGKR
jgi:hypothetical protein